MDDKLDIQFNLRMSVDLLRCLDLFRRHEEDMPTRAEMMRRLIRREAEQRSCDLLVIEQELVD